MLRQSDLPAAPPPGVIGLSYPRISLKPKSISIEPVSGGTGFYVAPDLLLITAHQNFRHTGPAAPDTLSNRHAIPYLLFMGSFPRFTPWQSMLTIGGTPIATRIEHAEDRMFHLKGRMKGPLDAGWCLLRVDPPYTGPRIRIDFERELHPNQEVFLLRPTAYLNNDEDDDDESQAVSANLRNMIPYIEIIRTGLDEFVSSPLEFHAWTGRITTPPGRAISQLDASNPWFQGTGWFLLDFDQDLSGASGGPILIRENNEWIAVGLFTSTAHFDYQWIAKYQYGFFVRPDLAVPLE